MSSRIRIAAWSLLALMAVMAVTAAWAQQADQQPDEQAGPVELLKTEPEDPAVAAVLRSNPSTPAEWARAAKTLADLDRPDLGRQFVRRIIDARLSGQQLAELADQLGPAVFRSMATQQDMQPEARQLADAILRAVNESLEDPKRIARLISQLQDPSPEARSQARAGLQQAGSAAVGPLIEVLADPDRAAEHRDIRAALARMGSDAVGPLIALLEARDPKLVIQAVGTLSQMRANEAAIYLLRPYAAETTAPRVRAAAESALKRLVGPTPTRREAVRLLTERARAYFDGRRPVEEDIEGRVELWRWDEAARQCISKSLPAEQAASAMAARLARDAYALAPEDPRRRLLYLATMLETAACEAGLDKPLPHEEGTAAAEAAGFGAAVVEDVLEYAVAGDHPAAATAAARILGRIGAAEELLRHGPQPAALVRATRHPDRRLRMAAIDAIIRLQPIGPFAGSSYIPESLAFFAASRGARRALVAGPSNEDSGRLAGMLARRGLEVDTAVTGRGLMRLAVGSPDYELALIDVAIERPPADLLLEQLRHDCRTAGLRVGLIARSGYLQRARRIARSDPLALAFSRPHSDESLAGQVERLTALAPGAAVGPAQRQRQAAAALDHLAELSGAENELYDVRRAQGAVLAALYTPALSTKAVAVLGNLGTPQSQQALVELASRWTQPLEVRRAAVAAFRRNTEANGILLTTGQIRRQYDRYNQSEALDRPTQRILGWVLDCIEAPTQPVQPKGEDGNAEAERGT